MANTTAMVNGELAAPDCYKCTQ